ncbi:MAG: hypothetical protein Q8R28_15280 [Dehalococcoidia bacterium]|nr:hypothetical protein [Dehalococcoidia bacterium]
MAEVKLGPATSALLVIALYEAAQQAGAYGDVAEQVLHQVRATAADERVTLELDTTALPLIWTAGDHLHLWNTINANGAVEVFGAFYDKARSTKPGQRVQHRW